MNATLIAAVALNMVAMSPNSEKPAAQAVRPSYNAYVVAVDESVAFDAEWGKVVAALKAKHKAEVLGFAGEAGLPPLLAELRKSRPKYVCFVAKPESVGRSFVTAAHKAMRMIDDDPYGDAIWGIVTGYDAADALRIVESPSGGKVAGYATSMGGPDTLNSWERGIASDERTPDNLWVRRPGGAVEKVPTGGNIAKSLADAFNSVKLDYFVTSGHARERNWQIVYNKNCGMLVHTDDAKLEFVEPGNAARHALTNAHLRVYIGAGNCLIGHVDARACMATAWMRVAGVEQFCGYTVPSWYGFMGWGVKGTFESGRYSVPEAKFLENERLLWASGRDLSAMDRKGVEYDRDTFAYYGDPAQRIMFPKDTMPYTVEVKGPRLLRRSMEVTVRFTKDCDFAPLSDARGARPVMALLDCDPPGRALFGKDGAKVSDAVVTERFIFIPMPGHHAAGEVCKYVVKP